MQFKTFDQANDVLRAAPGTESYVQDLPIFRSQPFVLSCVELTEAEVAAVAAAGCVYLQVVGEFELQHLPYLAQLALLSEFPTGAIDTPLFTAFEGANTEFPLSGAFVPAFLQPLPGQRLAPEQHPCAVVCYALTDLDVARLVGSRCLYVRALGHTHPPIAVHATNPISFTVPAAEPAD